MKIPPHPPAGDLPIVEHRISIAPDGTRTPCVYRFGTVEQARGFAQAHVDAWAGRR